MNIPINIPRIGRGIRLVRKNKGTSLLAVLCLALGLSVAATAFCVSYGILWRPLPFGDVGRLVWIWSSSIRRGGGTGSVSMADFVDYRAQNRSFENLAAAVAWPYQVAGKEGPERVIGARVTVDIQDVLGVRMALGRGFQTTDGQEGKDRVAILGDTIWRTNFGADAGIIGKNITLSGVEYSVVGVLPPRVEFPPQSKLWTPLVLLPAENASRRFRVLRPLGRLKNGVKLDDVQMEFDAIARGLETKYRGSNFDIGARLVPLRDVLGGSLRTNLLYTSGVALLLFLMAWGNVVALLAMRAVKEKEKSNAMARVQAWSLVISAAGAAAGLGLTVFLLYLLHKAGPDKIIRLQDIRLSGTPLSLVALTTLAGFVLTAIAASRAARPEIRFSLHISRTVSAVLQVAVAVILMGGAAVLSRGFTKYIAGGPGFQPADLFSFQLTTSPAKYPDTQARLAVFDSLFSKLRALPGVESVGAISELPLSGQTNDILFIVEGRSAASGGGRPSYVGQRLVGADYFKTLGIPLVKGRFFEERDAAGKPNVVLINDVLAREFFFLDEPIGKQLSLDLGEKWTAEIVGVIGSVRHGGLGVPAAREVYVFNRQRPAGGFNVVLRHKPGTDTASLISAVKAQVKSTDPDIPVSSPRTMDEVVADSLTQPVLFTTIVRVFGGSSLFLALAAVFGLAAAVAGTSRTPLRSALIRGMIPAIAGLGIGYLAERVIQDSIPGFTLDPQETGRNTVLVVTGAMALLCLAASYLGGWRVAPAGPEWTRRIPEHHKSSRRGGSKSRSSSSRAAKITKPMAKETGEAAPEAAELPGDAPPAAEEQPPPETHAAADGIPPDPVATEPAPPPSGPSQA